MEVRLLAQSSEGGFANKEDLRRWLRSRLVGGQGVYLFTRLYDVPSECLVLFEMEGTIVGCAVVADGAREMTPSELRKYGAPWKSIMRVNLGTLWVWRPRQDVLLKESDIQWRGPGAPYTLTSQNVLKVFQIVSGRA